MAKFSKSIELQNFFQISNNCKNYKKLPKLVRNCQNFLTFHTFAINLKKYSRSRTEQNFSLVRQAPPATHYSRLCNVPTSISRVVFNDLTKVECSQIAAAHDVRVYYQNHVTTCMLNYRAVFFHSSKKVYSKQIT